MRWILTFLLLCCVKLHQCVQLGKNATEAQLGIYYNGSVANGQEDIYHFNLKNRIPSGATVQISVSSEYASEDSPVLFVARLMRGVISWSVPFTTTEGKSYNHVRQTLCPALNRNAKNVTEQNFFLDVSTGSSKPISYRYKAYIDDDFQLELNKHQITKANPAEPVFFTYTFSKDGEERVLVKAESESKTCAQIMVQTSKCPNIGSSRSEYSGVYATMTTQAGITVERKGIQGNKFYVVVIVRDSDKECESQSGKINPFAPVENKKKYFFQLGDKIPQTNLIGNERSKTIKITVQSLLSIDEYIGPILVPLIVFGLFYVVAFIVLVVNWCMSEDGGRPFLTYLFPSKVNNKSVINDDEEETLNEHDRLLHTPTHSRTNSSYGAGGSAENSSDVIKPQSSSDTPKSSDHDIDGYDWLEDIDKHKDVYRLNLNLYVSDLSKKTYKKLSKKFNIYYWNLLTIAVFYALPVVQLVLTYQRVMNSSGDQDICYYNFYCARPYHLLSAFNNVYSNIGYMMLGLLFVFLVMRRDRLAKQMQVKDPDRAQSFGIPKHYGILYAMGYALFMEGVMSACYHVCPNYSNFQFDTAFMYMIGILGCLRLYQTRHHDVFINGHFAYAGFAAVIFTAVIGVVFRSWQFWLIFFVLHVIACFYLSCQIYYMGRVKTAFKLNWMSIVSRKAWCTRPVYMVRFLLLVIFNIVNWALSINGIVNIPKDFATYLLGIIICNGMLYLVFYVIMKLCNGEKIKLLPLICVVMSIIVWGVSISFFVKGLTDWQLSPAQSREGNKDCKLLGFYDDHDLWHFLSAMAMFFTFLGVLTLDDDLAFKDRTTIKVF